MKLDVKTVFKKGYRLSRQHVGVHAAGVIVAGNSVS